VYLTGLKRIMIGFIGLGLLLLSNDLAIGKMTSPTVSFPDREGTLWAPYLEWSVLNSDYTGNPFDVIATVRFTHEGGDHHDTQMFYSGDDTWRFRFTATRTGEWSFASQSDDAELNNLTGKVTIQTNPDPDIKGFITTYGNKFARQIGEDGELEGYLFNVYQDNMNFPADYWDWENDRSLEYILAYPPERWATEYLQEARAHGSNTLFIALAHQWLQPGALSYREHDSENPALETFEMIEEIITTLHAQGGHLHIWMWGDQERRWTPKGLTGGYNGEVDRRLQRYIAARLGPLPGWTMSYGFDLEEWATESQTLAWAQYLHQHMGWRHLLMARLHENAGLDVVSNDARPSSRFYENALAHLTQANSRPVLYERRFYHNRDNVWTMERTRRAMWQFTLAGGAGAMWGRHHSLGSAPYPNPEQMQTFARFWQNRFLLGLEPTPQITDGLALHLPSNDAYIFYKEDTSTLTLDLSNAVGPLPAVAVDTKAAYAEVDLGMLAAIDQTRTLPYPSDWAIAVGIFAETTPADTIPPAIVSARAIAKDGQIEIEFSKPLEEQSATNVENYQIDQGIQVLAASLDATLTRVVLTTSSHWDGQITIPAARTFTITVNGVRDRANPPNTIAANSQVTYTVNLNWLFLPTVRQSWPVSVVVVLLVISLVWSRLRSKSR
jgi:hypothetical protein